MKTRRQIVRGFASEYSKGTKGQKGVMLDYLCASTGWSRANARRRLGTEAAKSAMGAPVAIPRRRPRRYGPAAIMLL
ncbi:MAG: integrase, partial [Micrococcaceae bacterium]|nr:integrase [Micrococcaceae bacterium]